MMQFNLTTSSRVIVSLEKKMVTNSTYSIAEETVSWVQLDPQHQRTNRVFRRVRACVCCVRRPGVQNSAGLLPRSKMMQIVRHSLPTIKIMSASKYQNMHVFELMFAWQLTFGRLALHPRTCAGCGGWDALETPSLPGHASNATMMWRLADLHTRRRPVVSSTPDIE